MMCSKQDKKGCGRLTSAMLRQLHAALELEDVPKVCVDCSRPVKVAGLPPTIVSDYQNWCPVGTMAVENERAEPHRRIITLKWSKDNVSDLRVVPVGAMAVENEKPEEDDYPSWKCGRTDCRHYPSIPDEGCMCEDWMPFGAIRISNERPEK